jgi:hypothetical protein
MTGYVVPDVNSLKDMLSMMFGDELVVTADSDAALAGRRVATYINDNDQQVAICASDESLVAYAGGALTMLPKDAVDEMLASNDLSEVIVGNFHEVMNICSRLLMTEEGAHLRLDKTLDPESSVGSISELQPDLTIASFSVTIPNYGGGGISFLVS